MAASPDPVETIRRFVGRPDLPLIAEGSGWRLPYPERGWYSDTDGPFDAGSFTVDEAGYLLEALISTGLISILDDLPNSAIPIDRQTALTAVQDFLMSQVVGFDRLELVHEERENRGQERDGRPYEHHQFTWYELVGPHRAYGITRVHASVDTRGSLVQFVQVPPTPITVDVEPLISRDEAIAIARERYGKPITASKVGLHISWSFNNDGSQVLYWSIWLTGIEPWEPGGTHFKGAGYSIDAHTGHILSEIVSQDFSESLSDTPEEEWL